MQNQPEKAIEAYKKVIEDRKSMVPWAEPYIRVASLQSSNPEEAESTLDEVINGKNFDQWGKIDAFVKKMIVFGLSQDYSYLVKAYICWHEAKALIKAQVDSTRVKAYLGHYGKIASLIRIKKEAIEGAGTVL
jgi:hypothetical protein